MESKSKTLEFTSLKNPDGSEREVRVGDKVYLLNPNIFQNQIVSNTQNYVNMYVRKKLGKGPYEVVKIYQKSQVVYLEIKGRRGNKMDNIIKDYFEVC